MEPPEIDPELNARALEEAARHYPEFAARALRVVARPLMRGFAWQLEWDGTPPSGQDAWEFQNAAIRAYKDKNPDARPKAISEALAKEGMKVSAGYVSTVLSNERRKSGKRRKGKGARGGREYADLVQAKRLADAMGGIDKARSALNALAKILDA